MNPLITAIINALGAAVQAGVINIGQGHAAAEAIQVDLDHHKMLDEIYAQRIAQAEAEAKGEVVDSPPAE